MSEPSQAYNDAAKVKLILVATSQNWPNIDSVIHYKPQLKEVRVFATKKMQESALALKAAIEQLLTHQNGVTVEIDEVKDEPFGTMQEYLKRLKNGINDGPWILNATGGLKPFGYEIVHALVDQGETPWLTVIYRELDGSDKYGNWVKIGRTNSGIKYEQCNISDVTNDRANLPIAIQLMLSMQAADLTVSERLPNHDNCPGHDGKWPEPSKGDLESLLKFCSVSTDEEIDVGVARYKGFYGLNEVQSNGDPFEFLVFQTASFAGLKPRWGVLAKRGESTLLEFDVSAWVGDTFYVFDCKLTSSIEGGIVNYIQATAGKAKRAGGLKSKVIFVWPNVELTQDCYQIAEALGCEVWGPEEMRGSSDREAPAFFTRMGDVACTKDQTVKLELSCLDAKVKKELPKPFGSSDFARGSICDCRESCGSEPVVALSHDDEVYAVIRLNGCPQAVDGIDNNRYARMQAKILSPNKQLRRYKRLKGDPRGLIFPWGVELRWPRAKFCPNGQLPVCFKDKSIGQTIIWRATLTDAMNWACSTQGDQGGQGQDLVNALENLLAQHTQSDATGA